MPDGTTRELALVKKGRQQSDFIDPANPDAGTITWVGSWRTLEQPWQLRAALGELRRGLEPHRLPDACSSTPIALALIGDDRDGALVHARRVRLRAVPVPRPRLLFTLLLATIFLPSAVTLIPTYTMFVKLGWVGTWLPLLVPAFFANAYDVFLLRQYLLTIPRDLDEAATIDGAGPFQILRSVILPQAWPVIVAVSIFTFVYAWNDFFGPLIYLSATPELQPAPVGLQRFNGDPLPEPGAHSGRDHHDADHPGDPVRPLPARVHAWHRHHRCREVAAVAGPSGRAHVRRGAPGPAVRAGGSERLLDSSPRHGSGRRSSSRAAGCEAYPEVARTIAEARTPGRQPLLLPRADAAPQRRRASPRTSGAADRAIREHAASTRDRGSAARSATGPTTAGSAPARTGRLPARGLGRRRRGLGHRRDRDGIASALTLGLAEAPGDAIVLLHAWPTPTPGAVDRLLPRMRDAGATFVSDRRAGRRGPRHRPGMTAGRRLVLGVDGGNSKTEALLLDASGGVLASVRGPTVSHQAVGMAEGMTRLAATVARLRAEAGLATGDVVDAAVLALAGADYPSDERQLRAAIAPLDLAVRSRGRQRHMGRAACGDGPRLGHRPHLRRGDQCGRAGGRRPALAVPGGGVHLGRLGRRRRHRAWKACGRRSGRGTAADRPRSSGSGSQRRPGLRRVDSLVKTLYEGPDWLRVRSFAPVVFQAAMDGDAVARAIIDRQADELAGMAGAIATRLRMRRSDPDVVLAGAVSSARRTRRSSNDSREACDGVVPRARLMRCSRSPAHGAALLALDPSRG